MDSAIVKPVIVDRWHLFPLSGIVGKDHQSISLTLQIFCNLCCKGSKSSQMTSKIYTVKPDSSFIISSFHS